MKLSKIIKFKELNINILSIIVSLIITSIIALPINSISKSIEKKNTTIEKSQELENAEKQSATSDEIKLFFEDEGLEETIKKEKDSEKSFLENNNAKTTIIISENNQFGTKIRNFKPETEAQLLLNRNKTTYKIITNIITLESNKAQYISRAPDDGLIIIIKQKDIPKGIRIITLKKIS